MAGKQEKAARTKNYKLKWVITKKKEKKNFLHIFHSLILHSNILPMNPIAEKHCVMKNLNKNDLQSRFGHKGKTPSFLWFVFVLAFPFVQLQL